MALQSFTTVSIVTNAFPVHTWPSHETSSPRARKNTKDLVGIVFSRVVRSSEIQVEEYRLSLFRTPSFSSSFEPPSPSFPVSCWIQKRGQIRSVQIGFCVFRQTSGPLPGQETEDKENPSALCSEADWKTQKKYRIREWRERGNGER